MKQLLKNFQTLLTTFSDVPTKTSSQVSVILQQFYIDIRGNMADSGWGATESKHIIQVHIIRFCVISIINNLIIPLIRIQLYYIILYFIKQSHHKSKLQLFLELF